MSRMKLALLLLVVMFSYSFAQNLEAIMKTDAIHNTVARVISIDTITAYDNFISTDGKEYVIITIDQTPSFLLRIERVSGGFETFFVTDEQTIDTVLDTRYSQIENRNKNTIDLNQKIKADMQKFNESRFLHEAKYELIFGVNNSDCADKESCLKACQTTQVCAYALEKNGDSIVDDIIKYQAYKKELDSLVLKILGAGAVEGKSEIDTLSFYLDVVQKIQEEISGMQSSEFLKKSHILYSGQIIYDVASVNDAQEQIQIAIEPARAADERNRATQSIKEVTALRVRKLEAAQQAQEQTPQTQAQIELIDNTSESSGVNNQTQNQQYVDSYPPISQTLQNPQGIFTLENMALFMALLVVITTTVYVLYVIKDYLEMGGERRPTDRPGGPRGMQSHPQRKSSNFMNMLGLSGNRVASRGIPQMPDKKRVDGLEDLL